MKLVISTLVGYYNYGNRLQNYALQKVLEEMDNSVVTLRDLTDKTHKQSLSKKIMISLKNHDFFEKIKNKLSDNNKLDEVRENNFKSFTNKYINESTYFINEENKNYDFDKSVDAYVIGSDQVWNYTFDSFSEASFVEFSNKPKISYAASFGVSEIPKGLFPFYRKGLSKIQYLSVREADGKKIIKAITGKSSQVVVDPTLLLSKTDWLNIVEKKEVYNEKYVLTYFLGKKSRDQAEYINYFAKKHNLIIKELNYKKDQELWVADPSEFINLFSQADAVFTDSFHASVFSIIFEKYFEVFERNSIGPSMNSRLDTLLIDLNLTNRWHSNTSVYKPINYAKVNEILEKRKHNSMLFLKQALNEIKQGIYNE